MADDQPPVRVLRIIARMNVGGPALHVSVLSAGLDRRNYEHRLLTGALGAGEGSREALARAYAVDCRIVPGLGPDLSPFNDVRALVTLIREIRGWRPDVVHTHTAKAGALGRIASRLALGRRVTVVHTYHGHVLTGYFGPFVSRAYRVIEFMLARITDQLIGVSDATVSELVALRVAPRRKFVAIPIGLDLDAFLAIGPPTDAARARLGAPGGELTAVFAGRLVPIKRVDVLLGALAIARSRGAPIHLAIVGDGPLRTELERQASTLGLARSVTFTGFRDDMSAIAEGTDIAVLSSDNEGTPVALIEASAAGRPAVATAVGGVVDVVRHDAGLVVPPRDADAFAGALVRLAADEQLRRAMGTHARQNVARAFAAERLIDDIDALYRRLRSAREKCP